MEIEQRTKLCPGCGEEKPATTEHFYLRRARGTADRPSFQWLCIPCTSIRNHGPKKMKREVVPTMEERFWAKVDRRGANECWGWTGHTIRGYGRLWVDGRTEQAHRVSYRMHFGPIPDGLVVRHKCDNRICTNPAHLEIGTTADNQRDKAVRGRSLQGERHPQAKLTASDVRRIRELHAAGMRSTAIAKRFGIERSNVWLIATKRAWRHI